MKTNAFFPYGGAGAMHVNCSETGHDNIGYMMMTTTATTARPLTGASDPIAS